MASKSLHAKAMTALLTYTECSKPKPMDLIQTIIWSVAGILGILILGIFVVLALALNAYYHTDEGQATLQSAKDKNKK